MQETLKTLYYSGECLDRLNSFFSLANIVLKSDMSVMDLFKNTTIVWRLWRYFISDMAHIDFLPQSWPLYRAWNRIRFQIIRFLNDLFSSTWQI